MSIITYIKQYWDRFGVVLSSLITILCITMMVLSLYKEGRVRELPTGILREKPLPHIISHAKYEALVSSIGEPCISKKAHVRNIFARYEKSPVKIKPVIEVTEFKTIPERLRVTKIYRKPVRLLFKGYMQLPDGTYVATINWAGKTDFKKIGEEIRGYKVVDFKKDVTERKTLWGGTERVDKSIVTLERTTGEKFNLEIGHIALEKEIFAEIWDAKKACSYDVHVGSEILMHKVLDIFPVEVIIISPDGERLHLKKET